MKALRKSIDKGYNNITSNTFNFLLSHRISWATKNILSVNYSKKVSAQLCCFLLLKLISIWRANNVTLNHIEFNRRKG